MVTPQRVLKYCERRLGDSGQSDLHWYDHERPQLVTKKVFFDEHAWAVLVSGMSRKSVLGWRDKVNFNSVFSMKACAQHSPAYLLKRVGAKRDTRMGMKLLAVHAMGRMLFPMTHKQVASEFFGGTVQTAELGEDDAKRLLAKRLPFVGPANANFIIRNMGGELIKCDRWLSALMSHFGWSTRDLQRAADSLGWGLGRVDVVLWSYSEEHICSVRQLRSHFRSLGW